MLTYVYIHMCYIIIYTFWLFNIAMENPLQMEVLTGKSSINRPLLSMAMLNNQRVICISPFIVNFPMKNGDFPELCWFTRGYIMYVCR